MPVLAFADDATGSGGSLYKGLIAIGVGLGMGLAVLGAANAQGRIAAAFMEGTSRNPSSVSVTRTQLILTLIFVETLVLFTLLIALMLVGKV
jgi:F0F1-type ATP synthase membrane subunit c/vacuolar-type H+-ATPase subunit K